MKFFTGDAEIEGARCVGGVAECLLRGCSRVVVWACSKVVAMGVFIGVVMARLV